MLDTGIKNKVLKIIKNSVSRDMRESITEKSSLVEDLGIDSMTLIKIAIQIEEKLKLDLLDQANEDVSLFEIQTIEDVYNFIYMIKQNQNR